MLIFYVEWGSGGVFCCVFWGGVKVKDGGFTVVTVQKKTIFPFARSDVHFFF